MSSRRIDRSGLRLGAAAAAFVLMLAATSKAPAAIVLYVDTETGNMKLVGDPGDTLASYVVYSTSHTQSLLYTDWSYDRFGGTPVGATTATSVAEGFGTWHAMGTKTLSGQTTTYQLGEMCAVWAGFNTGGLPNAQTSKIYTFDATHTEIDLGNHFVIGSLEDLVFGYGTTPGFYNGSDVPPDGTDGWIFDGITHTYTVSKAGSYYDGMTYTSEGITGMVVYTPEPATMALLGIGALAMLRRRCRR